MVLWRSHLGVTNLWSAAEGGGGQNVSREIGGGGGKRTAELSCTRLRVPPCRATRVALHVSQLISWIL